MITYDGLTYHLDFVQNVLNPSVTTSPTTNLDTSPSILSNNSLTSKNTQINGIVIPGNGGGNGSGDDSDGSNNDCSCHLLNVGGDNGISVA